LRKDPKGNNTDRHKERGVGEKEERKRSSHVTFFPKWNWGGRFKFFKPRIYSKFSEKPISL